MNGLQAVIRKNGGKLLLVAGLAPLVVACAHTIDPSQTSMPVYEMPAAVVVQTSPAPVAPWQAPMPGSALAAAYATYPAGQSGATGGVAAPGVGMPPGVGVTQGVTDVSGYPTGSTVVRQAPITIERPTIVVNQPPVWVGNPPVAIPQPPVVMHQTPITVDQPSFVIHPPKVGFQMPAEPANMIAETKPAPPPEPKVAAVEPAPPAPVKAASSTKAKSSNKKQKKKSVKKAVKKAVPSAPAETLPPK